MMAEPRTHQTAEDVVSNKRLTWIEQHCALLVPIERETVEKLGEETAGAFVCAANDCVTVSAAVTSAYRNQLSANLVLLTLHGLFKEATWFHSLFVAGNYPYLLSRLRFVWESMFRAYFVEHYPMGPCLKWDTPGPTADDKVAWLEEHGQALRWDTCTEPVLRAVFPLADREQQVRDHYKGLFQELHRYAHPSAYLLDRMTDDSALHLKDGFDEMWARQAADIGGQVFDLVWMVVFAHHPGAFDLVKALSGKYPVVSGLFDLEKGSGEMGGSVS
jgi:hypothetical protein